MNRKIALIAVSAALLCAFFALSPSRPRAATLEGCPISLTNPDGQSLTMVRYDLRVAAHGALSLVEMEMTFRNPENRQMEGRFVYTLPPGATISRFAKEVNGKLMEGEVVERLRAQAIYTEILHTLRDPALLEADQGNRFSARVFPVPANGTVRLLLAFSQQLPIKNGVRTLRIPLAGLPKIGEFNFNAIGHPLDSETGTGVVLDKDETLNADLSSFSRHAVDYTPAKDIEISFKAAADKPIRALKAGNFQMVQFLYNPAEGQNKVARPTDWAFYFDTSASGADTEAPRLQVIDRLLAGLVPILAEKDSLFSAHAFDIDNVELATPRSMNSNADKPIMLQVVYKLRSRHALGATNLEAILTQIGNRARADTKPTTYVLASDGIATWGKREVSDLLAALGEWPERHTLHALVIGSKQDDRTLKAIVEKTRGRIVTLPLSVNVDSNVAAAISDLRAPLGAHFDAYDEGTAWIYPKSFHDVRPGTELIAFSEIKEGGKSLPGFVQRDPTGKLIKDTQVTVAPSEVADFAPLLQREAYKAYLDVLDQQEQSEKDAMKRAELHKKRIDISVKNRVMCPLTSLLVLETEHDYARFGIARTALADVMAVGMTGIELRKRNGNDIPIPVTVQVPAKTSPAAAPTDKDGSTREFSRAKKSEALSKLDDAKEAGDETLEKASATDRQSGRARALETGEGATPEPGGHAFFGRRGVDINHPAPDRARNGTDATPRNEEALAAPALHPPITRGNLRARDESGQAAASAPAAPVSPPQGANSSGERQPSNASATTATADLTAGLTRNAAAAAQTPVSPKPQRPDWTAQANEIPSDAMLSELRAKVQGDPHDRKLRNAYADALLKAKKYDNLQAEVFQWLPFDPENPAVYEYLGKSATGLNDPALALRAYSSIAEIAPNRAALLSRAGFLLLAAKKFDLAESMFREALKNRQDDCNIHRGLALTLWLSGNLEAASVAYETALMREYNQRYGDTKRVLREEFAYVLRAWRKKDPAASDELVARAQRAGVDLLRTDALRVTMCWETDANDVDLHVVDPSGEECFYQHMKNATGLELYSDQTQGLGPEVIRTATAQPGTYHIAVNYFSAGPMGVSRGVVVVLKPTEGIDNAPSIIPFALIEGGRDLRYVGSVTY